MLFMNKIKNLSITKKRVKIISLHSNLINIPRNWTKNLYFPITNKFCSACETVRKCIMVNYKLITFKTVTQLNRSVTQLSFSYQFSTTG